MGLNQYRTETAIGCTILTIHTEYLASGYDKARQPYFDVSTVW